VGLSTNKEDKHNGSPAQIVDQDKQTVEMSHPDYESKVTKIYDLADHVVAAIGFAESWDEVTEARTMLSKKVVGICMRAPATPKQEM
jgi:hypothetical protein